MRLALAFALELPNYSLSINALFRVHETFKNGHSTMTDAVSPHRKIEKTEEEWRETLSPEQFRILRQHGTERAFTGPNWDQKAAGIYACAGCGTPLFDASTKYDSGTGWPSFYAPVGTNAVSEHEDRKLFMRRTEIRCATCDGHLGHVFPDGPQPTGLRYCMNGYALDFSAAPDDDAGGSEADDMASDGDADGGSDGE